MVRYLIKHGTKIKLLPPPTPPEEQLECPKCKVEFDTGQYRRACIEVCGHVTCLQCIATRLNLKEGCEDCAKERAPPEVEPKKKKQPVLVLLPVLSKQGVSRESDEFPEIERLSLSALPVLERAGSVGSEDENEIEELEVDEDEEVEDIELPYEGLRLMDDEEVENTGESETVPEFIDISGDEEIPIVDLADSDDDNEIVENEEEILNIPSVPTDETIEEQAEIDEVDSEFEVEIESIPNSQPVRASVIRSTASLLQPETEKTTELVEVVNELEEADAEDEVADFDAGNDQVEGVDLEDDESEDVDVETIETTETKNFEVAQTDISENVEADNQIENSSEEDDTTKDSLETNEECENSTTVEIGAIENNVPEPDQEITLDENGNQPIPSTSRRERRKMLSNYNNYKTAYRHMGFGKHICQYCSDSFRDRSTLGLHLTQEHWDLRPFPCDICNWPFDSARNLEMHKLTHTNERPFKCSLCDSAFNRNFTLRKHMDKLHNVILPKMNRSKRGKYKKRILQKAIQQKIGNAKLNDAESVSEKIRNFAPKISKKRKYTRRKYKRARLNLEKEINYLEDEDDWEDNVETYKHKDSHECVMCQEKFNRRFSLERHMEHTHGVRVRLHPDETPQGKEYCPECQSLFGSPNCTKVAYSQCGHISCVDCVIRAELGCGQCTTETAHKVGDVLPTTPEKQKINEQAVITRREDDEDDDDDDNEPFDELVAEMDIIANLEVEPPSMKKPEKSYKCKYCVWPIEFSERRDLGNHMQHAHADKRPYPCEICNWPFASLKDLERHQLIHANEKPYKCAMCKSSFNRKSARDRHVEKVHLKWRRI